LANVLRIFLIKPDNNKSYKSGGLCIKADADDIKAITAPNNRSSIQFAQNLCKKFKENIGRAHL
jgi:hypothetical protein